MKLFFCKECYDIVCLHRDRRYCRCGLSSGMYVSYIDARVSGPCIKLGFSNHSFAQAIRDQVCFGDSKETMVYGNRSVRKGREFTAFIIPEECDTMIREDTSS